MPHHFVNRARLHAPGGARPGDPSQFLWERANTVVYLAGGALFVWGSILFFPALSSREDRGAWLFIVGSLLYLLVTGHDLVEVIRHRRRVRRTESARDRLEALSAICYVAGTVLFVLGSVCFLSSVGRFDLGAWSFVIGSALFLGGSVIDVLMVTGEPRVDVLQLMNLTALTFVTGSVLFLVASVPYLFQFDAAADERKVDSLVAAQYVWGSLLFLAGGFFNYFRARLVARLAGEG